MPTKPDLVGRQAELSQLSQVLAKDTEGAVATEPLTLRFTISRRSDGMLSQAAVHIGSARNDVACRDEAEAACKIS
jgi:hypothetical protein